MTTHRGELEARCEAEQRAYEAAQALSDARADLADARRREAASAADAADALTQLEGAIAHAGGNDLITACMRAAVVRLRAIRQRHGEAT